VPSTLLRPIFLHLRARGKWSKRAIWLLSSANLLLILLTVLKVTLEPSNNLAEFIRDLVPPLRVIIIHKKILVLNSSRDALNEILKKTLYKIEYPVVLENEVDAYKSEFKRRNWLLAAYAVISFVTPTLLLAILSAALKENVTIDLWLPSDKYETLNSKNFVLNLNLNIPDLKLKIPRKVIYLKSNIRNTIIKN
jgi:hypothetical protein